MRIKNGIKSLTSAYVGIGVGFAVVTVWVLAREGKNNASEITAYATVNGVVWPAAIYFGARKAAELKE